MMYFMLGKNMSKYWYYSNLCCEWQYHWYYYRLHEQVMINFLVCYYEAS